MQINLNEIEDVIANKDNSGDFLFSVVFHNGKIKRIHDPNIIKKCISFKRNAVDPFKRIFEFETYDETGIYSLDVELNNIRKYLKRDEKLIFELTVNYPHLLSALETAIDHLFKSIIVLKHEWNNPDAIKVMDVYTKQIVATLALIAKRCDEDKIEMPSIIRHATSDLLAKISDYKKDEIDKETALENLHKSLIQFHDSIGLNTSHAYQ